MRMGVGYLCRMGNGKNNGLGDAQNCRIWSNNNNETLIVFSWIAWVVQRLATPNPATHTLYTLPFKQKHTNSQRVYNETINNKTIFGFRVGSHLGS